ncbi:MAG: hypothetical protein MJY61_02980 [Bacteroidales bacterium]|nr:hypothetical protein [Bacteroidales bacterium]
MPSQKQRNNRGKVTATILAVFLSCLIWLTFNLSQTYTETAGAQIYATSNLEGRASTSVNSVQIIARVRASGFFFLREAGKQDVIKTVKFNPEDLVNVNRGDYFEISESALRRYTSIFGKDVYIESVQSGNAEFKFLPESHKKVPVRAVQSINFKPQYCAMGGIKFAKDSVTVYGEPSKLEMIDFVTTSQISRNDVGGSIHGTAYLEAPAGTRLSFNSVSYSLDVIRFVEFKRTVQIGIRNVPRGTSLSFYPKTVQATFRCAFPAPNSDVDKIEFYIDYLDFQKSISGRCAIRTTEIPDELISLRLEPEVCECLVTSSVDQL